MTGLISVSPYRFSIVGRSVTTLLMGGMRGHSIVPDRVGLDRNDSLAANTLTASQNASLELIETFKEFRLSALANFPNEAECILGGMTTSFSDVAKKYYTVIGCIPYRRSILDSLEVWCSLIDDTAGAVSVPSIYDAMVATGVFDKPDAIFLTPSQNYPHIRAHADYFNVRELTADLNTDINHYAAEPSKISDGYVDEIDEDGKAPVFVTD